MNIRNQLQHIALMETCHYIKDNLRGVQSVGSANAVHDISINHVSLDGLALEFGVYKGNSLNYIASKSDWIVHGFDSFEGLPEIWRDGFDRGSFAINALPEVRANVKLYKGWFKDSLPEFLKEIPVDTPVSYLHIDCDLYSSTKDILINLAGRIRSGTVIVFDEYFNYDGWQHGEYLAFKEFIQFYGLKYRYLTYNHNHEQCSVVIY